MGQVVIAGTRAQVATGLSCICHQLKLPPESSVGPPAGICLLLSRMRISSTLSNRTAQYYKISNSEKIL